MNEFSIGAHPVPGGFVAWFRKGDGSRGFHFGR